MIYNIFYTNILTFLVRFVYLQCGGVPTKIGACRTVIKVIDKPKGGGRLFVSGFFLLHVIYMMQIIFQ